MQIQFKFDRKIYSEIFEWIIRFFNGEPYSDLCGFHQFSSQSFGCSFNISYSIVFIYELICVCVDVLPTSWYRINQTETDKQNKKPTKHCNVQNPLLYRPIVRDVRLKRKNIYWFWIGVRPSACVCQSIVQITLYKLIMNNIIGWHWNRWSAVYPYCLICNRVFNFVCDECTFYASNRRLTTNINPEIYVFFVLWITFVCTFYLTYWIHINECYTN